MPPPPVPDIRLPEYLRPADGRFNSGPSKVRPEAVAALADAAGGYLGTSHRQEGVRSVVRRARRGLTELLRLPDDYEVLLGVGGATQFWDMATFGLIARRSQHLVFGEFSSKFAAAARAAPHLDDPDVIESEPGTHPEPVARDGVDAYALIHSETSTGVAMDIRRPAGAGDGALVLVDATSAAGGLRVDPIQFDVYYFSPQKVFASEGGLWVAACSPAAVARIERLAEAGRWVPATLDLKLALDNSRLDQTYNTHALATIFLLTDTVEWMNANGGLDFGAGRCDRNATVVYGWAEATDYTTPFVADPSQRSHTVATVDLDPAIDAKTVCGVLRANGVLDIDSYRKLGRNQLRIAMFPAIDAADLEVLTGAVDHVAKVLRG